MLHMLPMLSVVQCLPLADAHTCSKQSVLLGGLTWKPLTRFIYRIVARLQGDPCFAINVLEETLLGRQHGQPAMLPSLCQVRRTRMATRYAMSCSMVDVSSQLLPNCPSRPAKVKVDPASLAIGVRSPAIGMR